MNSWVKAEQRFPDLVSWDAGKSLVDAISTSLHFLSFHLDIWGLLSGLNHLCPPSGQPGEVANYLGLLPLFTPWVLSIEAHTFFFFFKDWISLFLNLFIYFWLCWVFISVRGLPLAAASGGHSSSRCAGLSLSRPLVVEHRLQMRRLSSCGSRAQLLRGM